MPGAAPPLPQSVVFNTFASYAFPVVAIVASSYSPCPERASATPRNLDTEQPFSHCYELPTQLRLESVANAHTAADLHVRSWVSNRAGQESGSNETISSTSLTHRWVNLCRSYRASTLQADVLTHNNGSANYLAEACVFFPQSTTTYAIRGYNRRSRKTDLSSSYLSPLPAN
jgi:hypothetical protein